MPPRPENQDPLAREVERLLRKLPGADPSLRGTPEPTPRPAGVTTGPRVAVGRPAAAAPPSVAGVWGRVATGVVLAVALTQWPYRTNCGWPVLGYVAAVGVLLVVAAWAAVGTWRLRLAAAHVLALAIGFAGIVFAAERILPRVGYAAESATWRCSAPAVPARPAGPPARPPGP